ncbi:DgyrCDS6990 [Dimorphilus gyrociliatus]|uniref:DgyrCDS6990 n=1 Tax=Dimorphilus gyrociliatus TaxID=2664684 RepID=A0A7I8VPT9_9ANNE|nr:DgyrCDS6990 [Dimorphilus gyrociliatus]
MWTDEDINDVTNGLTADTTVDQGPQIKRTSFNFIYIQCYFVTIATILGTGILGLPVTLTQSGIYPFLILFILGCVVQAILIVIFTEILQKAQIALISTHKSSRAESAPLYTVDEDESPAEDEVDDLTPSHVQAPNLHALGNLFLPCVVRQCFDGAVYIQFIALLTSYALAGSEAFAQLIGIRFFYVIPLFVWVLTFAIIFGLNFIQPVVSLLTLAKGILLLATVAVTFFVGTSVPHDIRNDYTAVGEPFLMGTVALGGVINVMPFLYNKIERNRRQVSRFRFAIVAGLVTCTILNILWCWAVLDIVPQKEACYAYQMVNNSFCRHNSSLEESARNGEISTIPLTSVIKQLYPSYGWVAILIRLFIVISITVSYLTMGAAMFHTIRGFVATLSLDRLKNRCISDSKVEMIITSSIGFFGFSIVFVFAMLNPKGFENILEKLASLFINLESGLFVTWIALVTRTSRFSSQKIPNPLGSCSFKLVYTLPVYFGSAIFYDIYKSVADIYTPSHAEKLANMTSN